MMRSSSLLLIPCIICFVSVATAADQAAPSESVSYSKDIAPILQRNCVACHRAKQAEGGLSLETTKALLAGGDSGSLLVAKQADSSLLFSRATDDDDPMPPEDNSVGADRLSEKELALLKTWIDQGATIDKQTSDAGFDWQPIPLTVRSTYSMAISPDNRFAAIGHANRVEIADVKTGQVTGLLVDDQLAQEGAADVDVVQAIAFSALGDRIATGGFRTVRIWKRQQTSASVPTALKSAAGKATLSPDRSSLAVVNAIGDIEVWDLKTDKQRYLIPGLSVVNDIDWLHADSLVIGDADGRVRICNSDDGVLAAEMKLNRSIRRVAQSSDGRYVAALGTDGVISWFDQRKPITLQSTAQIKDATAIQFLLPNTVAVATASGAALLIDVAADRTVHQLDHGASINAIAANKSAGTLATGGSDGQVKLWNLSDGKLLHTLTGDGTTRLQMAMLDQDVARQLSWNQQLEKQTEVLKKLIESENAALAKVTEAREKAVKELTSKKEAQVLSAKQIADTQQKIAAAKTMIDQANLVAVESDNLVATSKSAMAKITAELPSVEMLSATAMTELQAAQAKADEAMRLLAAASKKSEAAATQVTEKKKMIAAEQMKISDATTKLAASKKVAADSKVKFDAEIATLAKQRETLAAAVKEVETKQADLAEREQAFVTATKTRDQAAGNLPRHQDTLRAQASRLSDLKYRQSSLVEAKNGQPPVSSIAFSDDSTTIAIVDSDGGARTFDPATGNPLDRFHVSDLASSSNSSHAFFIAPNRLVADFGSGTPQVIAIDQAWVLERTIGGADFDLISDRVTALDFTSDGASIAIGSGSPSREGQVMIVATASGTVLRQFENVHSDTVLCLRFSPDDRILATASADKTIRLLEVQSKKVIGSLDGHTHHVLSIAWKQDGRLLASGSADGTIKTWDIETGQKQRTIGPLPDEITSIEFLGASTKVVSACADGQIRVYETNNGALAGAVSAAGDFLFTLGVTPDGERVLSAGQKGVVNVWTIEGLKSVGVWP